MSDRKLSRRAVLGASGLTLAGLTPGCAGLFETRTQRAPPLVEDRPDAVYYPTHVEGMSILGMASDDRYRFALTFSFPHRFWLVNGTRTNQVELEGESDVHLMVTVWDGETGRVLPSSNQHVTVTGNGETPVDRSLWPMLSQNMDVHFGDNVSLAGDGTYEVSIDFGPIGDRTTGALTGAFAEPGNVSLSVEFNQADLEDISFRRLPDQAGERGALQPMDMDMMPVASVPQRSALPGRVFGEYTTGDAIFLATALPEPPTGVSGSGEYLAVSPRTPYNRYPLPFMGLTATVQTDDGTAFDGSLTPTLDSELGYHYGAVVDGLDTVSSVTLTPGAPPQLARHEGYETAFLDLSSGTISP